MIVDEEMNKWNFEFEQAVVIMSTNLTLVRKEMICVYRIENPYYERLICHYEFHILHNFL